MPTMSHVYIKMAHLVSHELSLTETLMNRLNLQTLQKKLEHNHFIKRLI